MEMLVTSGLNELKLLDSRIDRKIGEAKFVASSKKSAKNVLSISKDRFRKESLASYNSINDLITRRNSIKSSIVKSNATTEVEVAGVKMTVAEAIERKDSIQYERDLLFAMKTQYSKALNDVEKNNNKVDASIEELLKTAYGRDSKEKVTEEMHNVIANPYKEANEYELVDVLDIKSKIETLEDSIESFLSEVDVVLQVSNSTTVIDI